MDTTKKIANDLLELLDRSGLRRVDRLNALSMAATLTECGNDDGTEAPRLPVSSGVREKEPLPLGA